MDVSKVIQIIFRRYDGDIALIAMQMAVKFSDFLDRIALPSLAKPTPGKSGFVVGYGRSEKESIHEIIPRRIEIPIVDLETCYQSHVTFAQIKSRDAFCAGKPNAIPCNGDSGGSFYVDNNRNSRVILGVVSVGIVGTTEKPCNDQTYALFVDVSKYVDWIKQSVGGSGFLSEDQLGGNTDDDDDEASSGNQQGGVLQEKSAFCEYIIDDG